MKDLLAKFDNQHLKENAYLIVRQINALYDKMVNDFAQIASRFAYIIVYFEKLVMVEKNMGILAAALCERQTDMNAE